MLLACLCFNRDQYGRTPVHFAAACGHVAILESLLNANGSPVAPDNSGYTPIHWAAYNGKGGVSFGVASFYFVCLCRSREMSGKFG